LITVETTGDEVIARFRSKRWVFPAEDCMLMPIGNTTAEEIAWWIANELRMQLGPSVGSRLNWLEIGVDENNGQWGYCRVPWAS